MNLIDLELFKWKWFHDVHLQGSSIKSRREKARLNGGLRYYWKEEAAFIATLPRQSGKTDMLVRLSKIFESSDPKEEYMVVASNQSMRGHLVSRGINPKRTNTSYMIDNSASIKGIRHSEYNLMIDEYQTFEASLDAILIYPWKTVTMVGTLR